MRFALVAALLLAPAAGAQIVTDMTPELIAQAIKDEKNKGCYPLATTGTFGTEKFGRGCFTTPYSRVALAAREARERYQAFSADQVTPEMIAPELEVIAIPQKTFVFGRGMEGPPASVKAVVVIPTKSKDRSQAILPLRQEPTLERYSNMLGATWEAAGMVATFPLSALSEKHEIRFVYEAPACQDWKGKVTPECATGMKLKDVR